MTSTTCSPQEWEADWWGDCTATFGEEAKQLSYAHRMGIRNEPHYGKWPVYDITGRSVLDLGGGPVSMLLKTRNGGKLTVVDPCPYPQWVGARYAAAGVAFVRQEAERFLDDFHYDEVWIYNVLQHVVSPESCIATAKAHGTLLRIFEWVGTETNVGHPHSLSKAELDAWIGNDADGTVSFINENGAYGLAYYGAFAL